MQGRAFFRDGWNIFGVTVVGVALAPATAALKVRVEEREAERDLIHDETAPLVREIKRLKAEIASLRQELGGKQSPSRPY